MNQRILFVNVQGHGHIYPSLGMVGELADRGHHISYVTGEHFADDVAGAGAEVILYKSEFDDFHVPDVVDQEDAEVQLHRVYVRENVAILTAAEAALSDNPPDLIAYDVFPFIAGRLLATSWKRPAVRLTGGFAENEHYSFFEALWASHGHGHPADIEEVNKEIADLLARYGIKTPVKEYWREIEDLCIVYLPKSFQVLPDTFDERFAFVGPSFTGDQQTAAWEAPPPDRRVLLVSLGNQFNEHPDFFRACADAFAGTSWHVVMAIGSYFDKKVLGELPPNVEAHEWVSFKSVLEQAEVCLTHGTTGAVMSALDAGVPLALVPHFATEAAPTRERVLELGLGAELGPDELHPASIRQLVERVADDQELRERVNQMQRDIDATGGPVEAADAIEAYLERATKA